MEQMVTPTPEPTETQRQIDFFGIPEKEMDLFRQAQSEFESFTARGKLVDPWLTAVEE